MKIGLIGCGKMGGALLRGVLKAGIAVQEDLIVYDRVTEAVATVEGEYAKVRVATRPADVAAAAELVILAVKPQDMQGLLKALGGASQGEGPVYLSIAAGITLAQLESWLGGGARVIRSMPNTPALLLAGASAYARGSRATEADIALAAQVLQAVGTASEVGEHLLDAVTGLSGSGPAYVYTVIEALADGGVLMGLSRAAALQLAAQTVAGAAQMVLQTGKHPAVLRDEVTSPGGTTIAGLEQLEAHGLRHALIQAVRKASERGTQLAQKE
jgi:pyrroline-5-carboxylate reductase